MIVLGEYVWEIPLTGGKAFNQSATNSTMSLTMHTGTLLNGRVIQISRDHYLITLNGILISGT